MSAAPEQIEVLGLTADSRKVAEGYLFAAVPGARADGRAFIDKAVARGAVAVLAPEGTRLKDYGRPVLLICDQNPRRRLARMAATFYKRQPRRIVAVTGTNGKTSVASFTREIWMNLGLSAASLGTLGLVPPRADAPAALTTPDPVALMRCLDQLAAEDVQHLAIEASSHGLEQSRLDGVRLQAAAFTNLSRDHLDYHGTMAAYLAAKSRLFAELLPADGTAVINADAPEAAALTAVAEARGQRLIRYGHNGNELRLRSVSPGTAWLDLEIEVFGTPHHLRLPVAGTFQAMNALAALGLVLAEEGVAPAEALAALARVGGVPGRVEHVGTTPAGGEVYVDYAHTPDALETVLRALRPHTAGRLFAVYGCGGDRDPGKRPMMGEVARRLADRRIITDDNPRSEDPALIRAAVAEADPEALNIGDRRRAIEIATGELAAGDLLVIAGKGHESGQIVGDKVLPFDDREVARAAIAALGGNTPTGGRA